MERLPALIGRYPRLAALLFGLLAATGFPPLGLWPLALLGMAGLFHLAAGAQSVRRAALLGWLFGVAHFTLANNWIATAFTYQAEMPQWLGWIAVPLLALYLAVYPALAAAAVRWLGKGTASGLPLALLAAGAWTVSEWLRSWVFTGYAWDPFGLALLGPFDRPGLAALLPWLGTYALSGLAVLLGVGLWHLLASRRWLAGGAALVLMTVGMYLPAPQQRDGTLAYTLIQPDIRQEELDDPTKFEEQFQRIARLTARADPRERRLVLWPESGVPDYLRDGYPQRYYDRMTAGGDPKFARFRIGRTIGPNSLLLTGAVDLEIRDGRAAGARNAVTALDSSGRIVGGYDKAHLVPYGEYLALRWLLEPLGATRLVAGTIDFWPGPGPRTLDLGAYGRAGIQICYEIVFSGQVADRANRPDYLFNPSNDGWFGSWGPPQHLAQARMRAIEEGLPVLRSTTTGISAVIDAQGVVRQHIPMHRAEKIEGVIPPAAAPTLFSRLGNALPLAWAFLALAASVFASSVAMRRRSR
ncbi:apolipoprotein N-acyltransferase [Altererythrobacter sp. H2]|uniref:apolipoprotein N-acyltransferase n=1 Tax=Altererythrobacter sp. H2 TaxID=3108391 RepID=UPI000BC73A2B|nr:apolipoprotein N-acyltransferase [Altererythrobacter sp. H2]OZA93953.1 MAG: apolipoprotein N-acyltransferase [Erythrobacter sp. 34-65-8]WRK96380.1 apolipoprotein N-acyltransferase [Altererythrobacter sp. H2]